MMVLGIFGSVNNYERKIFFIEKYEMPEIYEMRLKTFSTIAISNDPDEASACFSSCCFTRDSNFFSFEY